MLLVVALSGLAFRSGAAGNGTPATEGTPRLSVGGEAPVVIVVDTAGVLHGWGYNGLGSLGNGANADTQRTPAAVVMNGLLSGKTIVALAGGTYHMLALDSDGRVYAWGYNRSGQLGDGTTVDSNVPVAVYTQGALEGERIIAIAAGWDHSLALSADGAVYAWGRNGSGQLGDGTTLGSNVPVAVRADGALSGKFVTAISAGGYHSLALTSEGTVYAWGLNNDGALGDGGSTSSSLPVRVYSEGEMSGAFITAVSGGGWYSLALSSGGVVYAWGNGQWLGRRWAGNSAVPIVVREALEGRTITAIAAGRVHALVLDSEGAVHGWGRNDNGGLCNRSLYATYVPVTVVRAGELAGTTISRIFAGAEFSYAVSSDRRLYAWGLNRFGQVGDGTTVNRWSPVATLIHRIATDVADDSPESPSGFTLRQNYPNPFNPSTTIRYGLPIRSHVSLTVYNTLGQGVATLMNGEQDPGYHEVRFDGSTLPSGVYFYRLQSRSYAETKKLLLIR
ncbi:MAG: T9SS type A sorting domain-containing protein [Ignavibacteriae bacterium]|nr:T9SS type A sorting domain-containing protein [Ignavibacteriota bacterium]